MHVVFRESRGLEEAETPTDLGQSPGDLVVLSFSDSDLGAFAEGWRRGGGENDGMPSLRLANLAALKHPLSVDTYLEQTLSGAKGILIRLIGGVPYWSYGLQQVGAMARERGIALAVLPGDGRPDAQLSGISTLPASTLTRLQHLCDTGGAVAAQAALAQLALAAGLYAAPVPGAKVLPMVGGWHTGHGVACPLAPARPDDSRPVVLITFYRAYVLAADTGPIDALFDALTAKGFRPIGLFAPSLKAPEAAHWLRRQVAYFQPAAIVNATAFSGQGADGISPLDASDAPVFQVALATSSRNAWEGSERGLSPADLAMHVVLPEVDGRLFAGVASFKEAEPPDPQLEFGQVRHQADRRRIAAVAEKVAAWHSLATPPSDARHPALILSTYPGQAWNMAHAVGLDALASANAILSDLRDAGHDCTPVEGLQAALQDTRLTWRLSDYRRALERLPRRLQQEVLETWGLPEDDPALIDGAFAFAALQTGKALVALQPERGTPAERDAEYHDLTRVPRHSYVAFYLWLQSRTDALIHIGAHGTLEWLPGKSVALSDSCWPDVLTGPLPVIYPFIVNDPGEAAQAKRRIGAVTLGHVPPPLKKSATPQRLVRLEALLDEFSNADGLDPKRRDRLQDDIRAEAQSLGVEEDLGLSTAACSAEAITRIDRFVCDIKDSQFGDGLHVWGRPSVRDTGFEKSASARAESAALPRALSGKRMEAGPSGSPYRGRLDTLPTGRNLFTTDPRAVPSRAAHAQGIRLADDLVRRHLQDEGDWPRGIIVDLWGSSTMRTAGEDFAMALHLLGCRPVWDANSERVSGVEALPIAELDRPRIDVTLRVSGLFRDVFPQLSSLFAQAVAMLAVRDEAPDWNPFAGQAATPRVYGPRPGSYGLGMGGDTDDYSDDAREEAGRAWRAASSWALEGDEAAHDPVGLDDRLRDANGFVHAQDLPETDLLLASDYAAHEAGIAAAMAGIGTSAQLYHLDNSDPTNPRTRSLSEEIARVVQARAANPDWIAGMRRHGFRGAAEIAATLDHMARFAHLAGVVGAHHFDSYYTATLGDADVAQFLQEANPGAYRDMLDRFQRLDAAGLWQSRSNSARAGVKALS